MDKDILLENIKTACESKGEKVTPACVNAGVGSSFVADIRRGQVPSVEKVARLAAYLGVTTSELLGEDLPESVTGLPPDFLHAFLALPSADREEIMAIMEYKAARNKKGEREK